MKTILHCSIFAFILSGITSHLFAQYCTPSAANPCTANGGNETISRFILGTIDNSSGCSPVNYEDFFSNSNIEATLTSPGSYPVSVYVAHADFASPYSVNVWIDLDSNQSFLDAGELVFHRNQATDCGGFSCNNVLKSGTLTIPAGVTPGIKRLRVRLCYKGESQSQNVPCGMIDYGEAEDYRIVIAGNVTPSVSTGTITGSPFCAGASVSVPFSVTGNFSSGNVFTAQLSDASGSFASAVTLGTLNGTASGTISGTIPANTPAGANYRIRVVSSNPSVTGADNGVNLTINATVTPSVGVTANPTGAICSGAAVTFTVTATGGGAAPVYQWKKNGANTGTNAASYSDNQLANGDVISCEMTSNALCASPATVTSNTITMSVSSLVTPSINISSLPGNSICKGDAVTFTASVTGGGATPAYQWKKNGASVGGNTASYSDNNLSDSDTIRCELTSSSSCASPATVTSNMVVMTVGDRAVAGTISAIRDTICSGTPGTISVTGSQGAIQWQESAVATGGFTSIPGQTNTTYITAPPQTTYYRVYAGSGQCVDSSNVLKLIVAPSPIGEFTYTPSAGNEKAMNFNSSGSSGATIYKWDFGDGSFSSEENPAHTYVSNGSYHVCLEVNNGSNCSFTVCKDIRVGTTGITDYAAENKWIVFPNPVSDAVFVKSLHANQSVEFAELFDLTGRLVQNNYLEPDKDKLISISTANLPKGTYILKIKTSDEVIVKRMVKQ